MSEAIATGWRKTVVPPFQTQVWDACSDLSVALLIISLSDVHMSLLFAVPWDSLDRPSWLSMSPAQCPLHTRNPPPLVAAAGLSGTAHVPLWTPPSLWLEPGPHNHLLTCSSLSDS